MVSAGFTSEQALMHFGVLIGMTYPLLFLPSTLVGSLSMALIPDLASAKAFNNNTQIANRIQSSLIFSFFISCLCIPAYIVLGQSIGTFLFDNTQAGIYLANSAWIMIAICVNNISATALNALGLEVKSFKNYICGAIFMILALWFLPAYIGVESIIVGMGACMVISTILNLKMLHKAVPNLKFIKKALLLISFIIPTILITQNIYDIISLYLPIFFTIVICGCISVIIYTLLCYIFNVVEIKTMIISKLKKSPRLEYKNTIYTHT